MANPSNKKLENLSLKEKTDLWLKWDRSPDTRKEIESLVASGTEEDTKELEKRLVKRIAFGTAGLRGRMCAGFAFMNHLTVQQASQGLFKYLEKQSSDEEGPISILIGYDGRYHSKEFAEIAASVFLSQGAKVWLFNELVPTPFVAYGTKERGCAAGIMVTASHNPKDDNGYKVYWKNACQIVSPHDKGISAEIEAHAEPWNLEETLAAVRSGSHPLLEDPAKHVVARYYQLIRENYCFLKKEERGKFKNNIVFTPMHGVGQPWVEQAFQSFDLPPFISVEEQMKPDPEFPTVAFPNPEEGKGALKLAIETADRHGATLILANDPDSDRLAVAEKIQGDDDDKGWRIFNGNEIGILLADYVFQNRDRSIPNEKYCMLNTTVSSKMLKAMAQKEGFYYEETLTGFKWLGSVAERLQKEQQKHFLFAFEEAIGFLVGDLCLDKDGVRGAAVFAEMAYRLGGQVSVAQHLSQLYERYGYFETRNHYFFCYHPPTMFAIFDRLYNYRGPGQYPDRCGPFAIRYVRDLQRGYDSQQPDKKPLLPVSPSSPMLTFTFENGAVITLRGSGTEPKLKYYAELSGPFEHKQEISKTLHEMVDCLIKDFLEPEKNNLK